MSIRACLAARLDGGKQLPHAVVHLLEVVAVQPVRGAASGLVHGEERGVGVREGHVQEVRARRGGKEGEGLPRVPVREVIELDGLLDDTLVGV